MLQEDQQLVRWTAQNRRASITLGQAAVLLELTGADSVAALGGADTSRAVNYRQKLARLEEGLGLGPLVTREGNRTRVTGVGKRVAAEFRWLLRELRALERESGAARPWRVAAGDAWLQSVILPALASLPAAARQATWTTANLRAHEIIRGLKEGRINFGFLRAAEVRAADHLAMIRRYRGRGFALLAGQAHDAPTNNRAFASWLMTRERALIQQETTWPALREYLSQCAWAAPLAAVAPAILCETHAQAASVARQTGSWCIVPSKTAEAFSGRATRRVEIAGSTEREDMALVVYPRCHDRLPYSTAITRVFADAIVQVINAESVAH